MRGRTRRWCARLRRFCRWAIAILISPSSRIRRRSYNGYNYLLDSIFVGAFMVNGRDDDPPTASWSALLAKIHAEKIPMVTLARGDKITAGDSEDDILSPDSELVSSAELNDTGLVEFVKTPDLRTMLTADTGMNVEQFLLARRDDIRADVLKVGHHGSKYATSELISPRRESLRRRNRSRCA